MSSFAAVGPALGRALVAALFLIAMCAVPAAADPVRGFVPVKRHPLPSADPYVDAQIGIARLRQTADQLRLLATQPRPASVSGNLAAELARHETWLRQAESRVSTLADEWERRLRPFAGASPARPEDFGRALDLNRFFEAQSATLQAKLQRESMAAGFHVDAVRGMQETARVVIENMTGVR